MLFEQLFPLPNVRSRCSGPHFDQPIRKRIWPIGWMRPFEVSEGMSAFPPHFVQSEHELPPPCDSDQPPTNKALCYSWIGGLAEICITAT